MTTGREVAARTRGERGCQGPGVIHRPHKHRAQRPAVTVSSEHTDQHTDGSSWHPELSAVSPSHTLAPTAGVPPRTAGPRPTFLMSRLPRLSLIPYFPSLQAGTDPGFPLPRSATGGTYLPLLGGWTSRTRHKHGAADESWLALARRSEQRLTHRAPWPRSVSARLSPTSAGGPERTSPGNRRHPAGSRLIAPGPGKPHPAFASLTYVTAIGLFLLWRQ